MDRYLPYLPTGWIQNVHHHLVDHGIKVEMHNLWTPRIQRMNNRVIMDIVTHQIPKWAWSGINRCRLFLKATTISDITTFDGKFVPEKIRKLESSLRENSLTFPLQMRPNKKDISHWKYFIDSICCHGHLHLELGSWIRTPDQVFQYCYNEKAQQAYKRVNGKWQLFVRKSHRSRRFVPIKEWTERLPNGSIPTRAIAGYRYLIIIPDQYDDSLDGSIPEFPKNDRSTLMQNHIMGNSHIMESKMDQLKTVWHSNSGLLVGATDGGLKDMVGTGSYAIFLPGDPVPVIQGYSAEYQPRKEASSTRQELLGQLGLEYWLGELHHKWGKPRGRLRILLVTDSKASIDIMTTIPQALGIGSMLKCEMDVALEVYAQQRKMPWLQREAHKVVSHIEREESPDEFMWECNFLVDDLATKARTKFDLAELQARPSHVLPGVKIACKIDGKITNNNLYQVLQDKIAGNTLKEYLMRRNHWNESIYDDIAWGAHGKEFKRYPSIKRATLTKFIHGWLASNSRKYRDGSTTSVNCPLCGAEDSREHFFSCPHAQLNQIRGSLWKRLCTNISQSTENGCNAIFLAGISQVVGVDPPTSDTIAEWPEELREAYSAQENIGWIQVFYGRLSSRWESIATSAVSETIPGNRFSWTSKLIRWCWGFGIDLWLARNTLVHASDGVVSLQEKHMIRAKISALYEHMQPSVRYVMRYSLSLSKRWRNNRYKLK